MAQLRIAASLLAFWFTLLSVAHAFTDVVVEPVSNLPGWALDASLQLTLITEGDLNPLEYTVIPLTSQLGVNTSSTALRSININGNLIAADASNYEIVNSSQEIAYLSCDSKDGSDPTTLLRRLMEVKPRPLRAILLYSTNFNWCSIDYSILSYSSILSMVDGAEASKALSFLNETDSGEIVKATIAGNVTATRIEGDHNTVAMTVLYCITGVIILLFLFFLVTGAVRAHRNPEQYGPRVDEGGRTRQSRARGIARAVLDTIPIVKFSHATQSKPEPDVELSSVTTNDRQGTLPRSTYEADKNGNRVSVRSSTTSRDAQGADVQAGDEHNTSSSNAEATNYLGCSICTEDFTLGEDVRVLPCSHQFHPTCIDPWLINVAGTCPLCRFNLAPNAEAGAETGVEASAPTQHPRSRRSTMTTRSHTGNEDPVPPPLGDDGEGGMTAQRHRFSHLSDVNRLRNAPVEERIAALRQLRAEQPAQGVDAEERHQGARFAERLRERFRIRTRAQAPQRES